MEKRSIEAVIGALNEDRVRYLVAGGLAVVAHGYVRFTADLDLVLDLQEDNLRRAVSSLSRLGYRPRAPVEEPTVLFSMNSAVSTPLRRSRSSTWYPWAFNVAADASHARSNSPAAAVRTL